MSKYAEYIRSVDDNRTVYDLGEVGASVVYDAELNQTEVAFLTRKGDDLDFDGSHEVYIVDGNSQESIDEILSEIKETDIDFALATESISEGLDLTAR